MPSRRLHLPRLSLSRRAALWCGAVAVAGGATVLLACRDDRPAEAVRQERAAVAMMLYGQGDPDRVVAAGLHGLGGRPAPIRIIKTGRCRFTVATATTTDTVDFSRITALRYGSTADPAAAIARAVMAGGHDPPILQLVILDGADDAICGPQGCTGHRVFALRDAGRLAAAQAAATAFRSLTCPAQSR